MTRSLLRPSLLVLLGPFGDTVPRPTTGQPARHPGAAPARRLPGQRGGRRGASVGVGAERRGWLGQVISCLNGLEALEHLRKEDVEVPSLILLDSMMPKMSGLEVCATVRKTWLVSSPRIFSRTSPLPLAIAMPLASAGCCVCVLCVALSALTRARVVYVLAPQVAHAAPDRDGLGQICGRQHRRGAPGQSPLFMHATPNRSTC